MISAAKTQPGIGRAGRSMASEKSLPTAAAISVATFTPASDSKRCSSAAKFDPPKASSSSNAWRGLRVEADIARVASLEMNSAEPAGPGSPSQEATPFRAPLNDRDASFSYGARNRTLLKEQVFHLREPEHVSLLGLFLAPAQSPSRQVRPASQRRADIALRFRWQTDPRYPARPGH